MFYFYYYRFIEIPVFCANSVDTAQPPHSAASGFGFTLFANIPFMRRFA